METFLFLLELAGTVAFAVSGAVLGIEKHMDIFGVGLLGITTAVGGGILRDLVVGLTPPRAFQDPIYLLVALGVSVVLFFPFVRRTIGRSKRVFDALMLIMDAAGLGIFTITGMNTAITLAGCTDPLLLVFVGLLTGTGGGVLRDVLAGDMPYILRKHIYASAVHRGRDPLSAPAAGLAGAGRDPDRRGRRRCDPLRRGALRVEPAARKNRVEKRRMMC